MRIKIRFLVLLALISGSALVFLTVPCQSQASGLGVQFLQCNNGTLSAVNSISCTCGAPQTCASSGQLIVIYSRDDDNSGTITHAASDSVAGTTGWNQAGCAIGNLRIAHCIFWKIATTGTARGFTVSYTPTGVVQNAELSVYAFPNAPDPSPVDCFTAATFSSNAGTQPPGIARRLTRRTPLSQPFPALEAPTNLA